MDEKEKFLDSILGTSKLPKPNIENLYAFSTAYVTLNTNLGQARKDIEGLLSLSCNETNTKWIVPSKTFFLKIKY